MRENDTVCIGEKQQLCCLFVILYVSADANIKEA